MNRRSSWLFFGAALSALAAVGCGSPHDGADATYLVEIRCHTPEGAPVANVRLVHPESGESGVTSAQGKLSLRLAGHEGSEATLQVSGLPDGMVLADDSPRQHIVFKSLSDATGRKRFLTHDIVLTKSKETYVLLVSTAGAPNLPVVANGITLGKLNSRGAGAFRVHGQPGEELKVVLDTIRAGAARGSSLQTFTLPAGRSILSFQSDLTRVSTMMLGREGSVRTYPEIGVPDPHHPLTHHRGHPDFIEKVTKINCYHVELFAYFVGKLKATADGDGSLLDHSSILYGAALSDGNAHSNSDLPLVMAGRAGGWKSGRVLASPLGTPVANLFVNILNRTGLETTNFADSTGELT